MVFFLKNYSSLPKHIRINPNTPEGSSWYIFVCDRKVSQFRNALIGSFYKANEYDINVSISLSDKGSREKY